MSRRCSITGKGVLVGNSVSHANNKTKRRFLPNVKDTGVYSEALGRWISVRLSVNGLRTIEHNGGLDAWLMKTAPSKMDAVLRPLRNQVARAIERKQAAAK